MISMFSQVPRSAVVCPQNISLCPLVRIRNVYPFAGMPSALRSTFQYHKVRGYAPSKLL